MYTDYLRHVPNPFDFYTRSIAFYNSFSEENKHRLDVAKRVVQASIPIISSYLPIGDSISISRNGYHFARNIFETVYNSDPVLSRYKKMYRVGVSGISLASSIHKFTAGVVVTTVSDVIQKSVKSHELYVTQQYIALLENVAQTTISSLTLAIFMSGSLELMLILASLQMSLAIFQTYKEHKNGRYIESAAQLIMSCIYAQKAIDHYSSITYRNQLFIKHESLVKRISTSKTLKNQNNHPLSDLEGCITKNRVILSDANGKEYDFGSHFHGFGKQLVKGDNITFKKILLENEEYFQLEFKINRVFRDRLIEVVKNIEESDSSESEQVLSYLGSQAKSFELQHPKPLSFMDMVAILENFLEESDIQVDEFIPEELSLHDFLLTLPEKEIILAVEEITKEKESESFPAHSLPTTIKVDGLGTIQLGINSKLPNVQDKVRILMSTEKNIRDLIELTSLLDLPEACLLSTEEDIERLKIGHLFRNFFPKEATTLERSQEFFDLPIDQLKDRILEITPSMEKIINEYLPTMSKNEIIPGKIRYQIHGLSDEVYNRGGRVLMSAITGNEKFEKLASMLKMGMLSTELRENVQLNSQGLSPSSDWDSGGADSIYTQLIVKNNYGEDFDDVTCYYGPIRLLIALDALELGSYQYLYGACGERGKSQTYLDRDNIVSITQSLNQNNPYEYHEIMLKERVDPKFFKGVIVPTQGVYNELIDFLRDKHLVVQDANGNDLICNQLASSFIRIGHQITPKLVA